jgi:hypothetical protein
MLVAPDWPLVATDKLLLLSLFTTEPQLNHNQREAHAKQKRNSTGDLFRAIGSVDH